MPFVLDHAFQILEMQLKLRDKGYKFLVHSCFPAFSVLELLACLYIEILGESCLPFAQGSLSKQGVFSDLKYSIQCKFHNKPCASKRGYW